MPTTIRKVKGNEYLYFREWDSEQKERHDTYLGQKDSEEAKEKARKLERDYLLKQMKSIKAKLVALDSKHTLPSQQAKHVEVKGLPVNKIIPGDAYDILSQLPSNSIHLAITSPPYNLGIEYDEYLDEQEIDQYRANLKKVWNETLRVLVPGGKFALNIAPTGISPFRPIHQALCDDVRGVGFTFRAEILWYKQNMGRNTAWGSYMSPSSPHVVPSWEYVYVFHKGHPKIKFEGKKEDIDITPEEFAKFADAFWAISPETHNLDHPAVFPEELVRRLIKFYTYKGNIVLDMFGGVGTVALVALKNKRRYISIDISKKYCKTGEDKIKEYLTREKKEESLENYVRS